MTHNSPGVMVFDKDAREALVRITLDCLADDIRDMEKFLEDMRASSLHPQKDALLAEFELQMEQRRNTKQIC
jgi:hypothetical protein